MAVLEKVVNTGLLGDQRVNVDLDKNKATCGIGFASDRAAFCAFYISGRTAMCSACGKNPETERYPKCHEG